MLTPARSDRRPATLAADLRVVLARSQRRIRAERSDADLNDIQFSVLAALERHQPMTPRQLAEHERVQPPSMTRVVASLVERGFATRSSHPDDGRQALVAITAAGRGEVRETRRRRDAWLARRLAELSPSERAVLADAAEILRRIATR
jgi:DNA-binding MarR family transcriptional regulator